MEVNLFNASAYSKRMAGSDQDGADQSTLDEGTRSRADAEHIEAGGENATGNVIPEQTEGDCRGQYTAVNSGYARR